MPKRAHLHLIALFAALGLLASVAQAAVVVVAHAGMRKLDVATVERIYSGKVVELDGQPAMPCVRAAGDLRLSLALYPA